ncbi:uncharacterized protein LOC141902624 [Tubulanus polymorphus]|uniref:uncharacterized protein LOC141902624 n=1 Tax=Tubulanus polymorphus TaxID=672921 RepID=UPI003DA61DC9
MAEPAPNQARRDPVTALGSPVVNLTRSLRLSPAQHQLLRKGLTYCPSPKIGSDAAAIERTKGVCRFNRLVKLDHHFRDKPDREAPRFRLPSSWAPDEIEPVIAEFCNDAHELAQQTRDTRRVNDNLTKQEREALQQLRDNTNIVIKAADKGSATVIMDRDDYVHEAMRQLADLEYNQPLQQPIFEQTGEEIREIIENMARRKIILLKTAEYLLPPDNPKQRQFYLLPKIHKEREKWTVPDRVPPGRPIVSDCGSETYEISEWIDYYLQPIARSHPSYVKDTNHFLDILAGKQFSADALLVTMDIDSLYTNIPHEKGIASIRQAHRDNPNPGRSDAELLQLLEISLKENDFNFNENTYLQVKGTAMSKRCAPSYANIFVAEWEKEDLSRSELQPSLYARFIDDIYMVWEHGRETLMQFIDVLQTVSRSIKLKFEISDTSVNFLDVTTFKGPRFETSGTVDTKVYFKPTDSHQLLHRSSFHPKHTFSGIVKSQILRFRRICNNDSDLHAASGTVLKVLRGRGYKDRELRHIKSQALRHHAERDQREQQRANEPPKKRLPLDILPHSEANRTLARNIRTRFTELATATGRSDEG